MHKRRDDDANSTLATLKKKKKTHNKQEMIHCTCSTRKYDKKKKPHSLFKHNFLCKNLESPFSSLYFLSLKCCFFKTHLLQTYKSLERKKVHDSEDKTVLCLHVIDKSAESILNCVFRYFVTSNAYFLPISSAEHAKKITQFDSHKNCIFAQIRLFPKTH